MNDKETLVINEEMEITEDNFDTYFFDTRKHNPTRGQIMAKYTAMADFVDGHLKQQIIRLLCRRTDKTTAVTQLMRKLGMSSEVDSYRIPLDIARDLHSGIAEDVVELRTYRYQMEMYFYTWKECVPKDDPHWEIISIKNLDDFLDSREDEGEIQVKAKIVSPE